MLFSYSEGRKSVSDCLKASKDCVFTPKWAFPKKHLEGGLMLMLVSLIVGKRAGELIEVIKEGVYLVGYCAFHID